MSKIASQPSSAMKKQFARDSLESASKVVASDSGFKDSKGALP